MSTCSSCRASIRWVKTKTGRNMPIDAAPHAEGNIALVSGRAVVVTAGDTTLGPVHRSHFATCPNAAAHRKAR